MSRPRDGAPDAIVIGGGAIGSLVALQLARRGIRPLVLDRGRPFGEASSAAAGILSPQLEARAPGPFFDLALRSRGLYPALIEELVARTGIDVGYRETGTLSAAFSEEDERRMAAAHGWQRAAGLRVERLDAAALRALEPAVAPDARGGLYFPDDHQLDPRRLGRALLMAAQAAGVQLEAAEVRRVVLEAERGGARSVRGVDVGGAVLEAPIVVVAAGSWSSRMDGVPLPARAVEPARGQIVELIATAPPPLRRTVHGAGGYVVPRADGRLLCGATDERVGFTKEVTAAGVLSVLGGAVRLVPGLAGLPVRTAWAGFRPATQDELPVIGLASQVRGLILATGHYRNGILLAPVTAEIVCALAVGEAPPCAIEAFSPARPAIRQGASMEGAA